MLDTFNINMLHRAIFWSGKRGLYMGAGSGDPAYRYLPFWDRLPVIP